jgi:predicted alpha/beta-fold hydrolase
MPVASPQYKAKGIFKNTHVNTIYPAVFRPMPQLTYQRERLHTPDGDFLDVDWSKSGNDRLIIALHGLEGSANKPYIAGMARYFSKRGWDALGLNFRGCSGEPNLLLRSYHVGETGDLKWLINQVLSRFNYRQIGLVGYSLGGNVLLKYLGERPADIPPQVIGGVAFSVPCDVQSCNAEIDKRHNKIYRQRFLVSLNEKMQEKARRFPGQFTLPEKMPKNFGHFDDVFTAPVHGFKNAVDYWARNSSLQFLPTLARPALMVNAQDDTFLAPSCYPYELAEKTPNFYLECPKYGGHAGFVSRLPDGAYWSEKRAFQFLEHLS